LIAFVLRLTFKDDVSPPQSPPIGADVKSDLVLRLPADLITNLQALLHLLGLPLKKSRPSQRLAAVHMVLMGFWKTLWTPTKDLPIADPTALFLACKSLHITGQFSSVDLLTQDIAGFQFIMRCAFVIDVYAISKNPANAVDIFKACSAVKQWFTEKEASPFALLRTWQHMAVSMVLRTRKMPKSTWKDRGTYRVLNFNGTLIVRFSRLQSMIVALERDLAKEFQRDILLGINYRVSYQQQDIVDDLSNTDVDYSFLTDSRNSLLPRHNTTLMEAFMQNKAISDVLTILIGSDREWNKLALEKWLRSLASWETKLAAYIVLTSGAPGRLTEIGAMLFQNTLQHRRNLYWKDILLTLVRLHTKTNVHTGHEDLLPHCLSGFAKDILIQNLVLVRPFARRAAQQCFNGNDEVRYMYGTHLFNGYGKRITTESVSDVLRRYSQKFFGQKLGVADFRHITTHFRMKLTLIAHNFMKNDRLRDSIDAAQMGNNRSTQTRIYAQTRDAALGVGEDVLDEFLDHSMDWQRKLEIGDGMY
jgi:hypothetical protein